MYSLIYVFWCFITVNLNFETEKAFDCSATLPLAYDILADIRLSTVQRRGQNEKQPFRCQWHLIVEKVISKFITAFKLMVVKTKFKDANYNSRLTISSPGSTSIFTASYLRHCMRSPIFVKLFILSFFHSFVKITSPQFFIYFF